MRSSRRLGVGTVHMGNTSTDTPQPNQKTYTNIRESTKKARKKGENKKQKQTALERVLGPEEKKDQERERERERKENDQGDVAQFKDYILFISSYMGKLYRASSLTI
jgi:hypothetical protein